MSTVGSVFSELRRRGVLQATAFYIVGAWVVLQACDVLFPGAGIPESAIRYVFTGALLGFPLVMVFGWMYDISTRGIRRTGPAGTGDATAPALQRSDYITLSGLGAAGVVLVALVVAQVLGEAGTVSSVNDAPLAAPENSIAVLPFVNISDDPDNDYFGDGIAEELLNELANVSALHVAARTSSFYFKNKSVPIPSIGRQLGVRTVLEGSVRRAGDRIRITAQLIDVANGYHLWSDTFDRNLGDIFDIQEEIAAAITDALEVEVLAKASSQVATSSTTSFDAYDYFLLGQHAREQRNPAGLDRSIELFKQALDIDERFAPGYAALASSYLYQAYFADRAPEDVLAAAEPLVAKALELDPNLPQTHLVKGGLRLLVRDYGAADAALRNSLELAPNFAAAWSTLGFSLVLQSRLKEAAEAYERSEALDPMNAGLKFNIGALMMLTGRYDDGLETLQRVIELAPQRSRTEAITAHWSIVYGRYETAAYWITRLLEREPDSAIAPASVAEIYGNLGLWEKARDKLSTAYQKAPDNVMFMDDLATFYFQTGDHAGFTEFVNSEYEKIDKMAPTRHSPSNKKRYFWHGVAAVSEGDYVQAVEDLRDAAGGKAGIENAVYDEITALKYLAYALQRQGRHDEAEEILDKCLQLATDALAQGWATPTIYYRTAQVYALQGRVDKAIAHLEQAVDKGWRIAGALERDPLWSPIQDDERFQAIILTVNNELQRQRALVPEILADT